MNETDYFVLRKRLIDNRKGILDLERQYMDRLTEVVLEAAEPIFTDFGKTSDLLPFWINYPPKQRGRAPTGTAVPWGDMGEKAVSGNFGRAMLDKMPSISYPGLPGGADLRFATEDAMIHFDYKLTGPNDSEVEIVASPNQLSGAGETWEDAAADGIQGVKNAPFEVVGTRGGRDVFEPTLPPFYKLNGRLLVCLTYFLKVVYKVENFGYQPLDHLELTCVPNGLLMFDGEWYAKTPGLLIPGKDDKTKKTGTKRVRVRFNPLSSIARWRCEQFFRTSTGRWEHAPRGGSSIPELDV